MAVQAIQSYPELKLISWTRISEIPLLTGRLTEWHYIFLPLSFLSACITAFIDLDPQNNQI